MQILRAAIDQKIVIENLMQLYLHDMSEFADDTPDTEGKFSLGTYFDLYWSEAGRFPYIAIVEGELIGFALIRQLSPAIHSVAEFFILRSSRQRGLAKEFATGLFNLHKGEWRVAELENNLPAQGFWRSVIDSLTKGDFHEVWSSSDPKGPMQIFDNATC